jgi:hypothetical protein
MSRPERLEAEFNIEVLQMLQREGPEAGLHSIRFRQMIEQHGALEAAHRLLTPDHKHPPGTFGYLRRLGKPDLAIEYYVVMEKYRALFSPKEIEIAQFRLDQGD